MAKTMDFKARGLFLSPSDPETPPGALTQALNVVISRDGITETRRGQEPIATATYTRAFSYKSALVAFSPSASRIDHSTDGVTWTANAGSLAPQTGEPLRVAEASSNLFLTDRTATKRIDSLTGSPQDAGVPAALDVDLSLSAAGTPTALPNNKQIAYRVLFGKKDANGRLILGGPSGRSVVTNTSGSSRDVGVNFSIPRGLDSSVFYQGYRSRASVDQNTDPGDELGLVAEGPLPSNRSITQLVRASNVVTATTTVAHGYATGQVVRVSPGGAVGGGFAAVGDSAAAASSADGHTWTARSVAAGNYKAVAWNGTVFAAVGAGVAATSADGQTWTPRTIPAAGFYAVAWTGSLFVAVGGSSSCATSPDGITWTSRTIPAGFYVGLAWNGSALAAIGGNAFATSPDGITWTARTPPDANSYNALAWNGSVFVAVGGTFVAATSPDGITWTPRASPNAYNSIAWSGTVFVAVGLNTLATTTDGITWTALAPAGAFLSVAWTGSEFVAVGQSVAAYSADGIAWTTGTIPAGVYNAVALSGSVFTPGEKTITGTPSGTTFTYAEPGGNGTLASAQSAEPLTAAFLDTVPDGFIGAALYTNANQEGILNANERPPVAKDIAAFKGSLFLSNITTPAYGSAYLLAVGGSSGVTAGDTVTINGVAYTAAVAESVADRQFLAASTGTVSQKIRDTAASLTRVVNRSLATGVTVTDISDPDGVPGYLAFRATDSSSALTVTFSRTTSWSPAAGIASQPKTYANGFVWSKTDQPDSVPTSQVLLPELIGSADKAILRVIPTRSSLFFLKEDGIWKLTGDAGEWSVQPFDPTIRVVAPETAIVLDNSIWALSEQGVVRISDTGVAVTSRAIEPALNLAVAPAMRATTAAVAFAVGYESDRKFIVWLPAGSSDTVATHAYVYDLFTQAWTERTDDAAHAIVNPADGKIYTLTGSAVTRERKTLTDADYQDGDAQAIATTVTWSTFGNSPVELSEFQEITILWDRVKFTTATVSFSTNLSQAPEAVTLSGSDYGVNTSAGTDVRVLIWPPSEKTWGSQLFVTVEHQEAGSPNALAGLSVTYVGRSGSASR